MAIPGAITWSSAITAPTTGVASTAITKWIGVSDDSVQVEVSYDDTNYYRLDMGDAHRAGLVYNYEFPLGTYFRVTPLTTTPAAGRVDIW